MFCVKLKSMLFNFNISRLDQRLVKRYNNLVQFNMNPLASLAPAIKDIASAQKNSFATTQAVWRFLNNDKISFKQLNEPIQKLACDQIKTSLHRYAEPYRVCRRVNILRDYPDDKIKIYP